MQLNKLSIKEHFSSKPAPKVGILDNNYLGQKRHQLPLPSITLETKIIIVVNE